MRKGIFAIGVFISMLMFINLFCDVNSSNVNATEQRRLELKNEVALSAHLDKAQYASGENIEIKVLFKNVSDSDITLNVYDIEYRLKIGILLEKSLYDNPSHRPEVAALRMMSYMKRKMPIVTKNDFVLVKAGKSLEFKLVIGTEGKEDSPWRFVDATSKELAWRSGSKKLSTGSYALRILYANQGEKYQQGVGNEPGSGTPRSISVKGVWKGIVRSNFVTFGLSERRSK